jgi:hypothetical protein
MGVIQKGILGGFSGKVGTVVGASWRGKDVIRSLPKKGQRKATEPQEIQRLKFTLVAKFLSPIKPIVRAYFGQAIAEKSKYNLATSYHMTEAVTGDNPDFVIDFLKVILTKGDLLGISNPDASADANAAIVFNWTDNSGEGQAVAEDQVLAMVYNTSKKSFEYRQTAIRSEGTFTFGLPSSWSGDSVHCWLSVVATDAKKYSLSAYLGELLLL